MPPNEPTAELTGGCQSFELGQQPLHFKQTKVCVFKLTGAIGNLRGGFVNPVFEPSLLDIQLFGHLPYAAQHSIESGGEESDFVGRGLCNLDSQVACFGPGHRQQQAVDRFVHQMAEQKIGDQRDRDDCQQHQRPHQSTKLGGRASVGIEG